MEPIEPWQTENWLKWLNYNPIPALLRGESTALAYAVYCEILCDPPGPATIVWNQPEVQRIFQKQQPGGFWERPGVNKHPAINTELIETWKQLRTLLDVYGCHRGIPQMEKAAEFIFSCQTDAGDFRGFLANQYATYYTGDILSLLIRMGYENDPRVEKGMQWLLSMRQDDGGWTIPILTHKLDGKTMYRLTSEYVEPVEPIRSMPFSHNWTGMVLRAFAAHPTYRKDEAAVRAANLLKSRFFQPDVYSSYQAARYWLRFDYPFWWNNLVSALDAIAWIGLRKDDEQVAKGLEWLRDHQCDDGLWDVSYDQPRKVERENHKLREKRFWVTLAICRLLIRFFEYDKFSQ